MRRPKSEFSFVKHIVYSFPWRNCSALGISLCFARMCMKHFKNRWVADTLKSEFLPWRNNHQGLLIVEDSRSHSVGFLWPTDRPDGETSTWQHTTLTTDNLLAILNLIMYSILLNWHVDRMTKAHFKGTVRVDFFYVTAHLVILL